MSGTLQIGSQVGNPEVINLGISWESTLASGIGFPGLRPENLRGWEKRESGKCMGLFSELSVEWESSREQDRPGPQGPWGAQRWGVRSRHVTALTKAALGSQLAPALVDSRMGKPGPCHGSSLPEQDR